MIVTPPAPSSFLSHPPLAPPYFLTKFGRSLPFRINFEIRLENLSKLEWIQSKIKGGDRGDLKKLKQVGRNSSSPSFWLTFPSDAGAEQGGVNKTGVVGYNDERIQVEHGVGVRIFHVLEVCRRRSSNDVGGFDEGDCFGVSSSKYDNMFHNPLQTPAIEVEHMLGLFVR